MVKLIDNEPLPGSTIVWRSALDEFAARVAFTTNAHLVHMEDREGISGEGLSYWDFLKYDPVFQEHMIVEGTWPHKTI